MCGRIKTSVATGRWIQQYRCLSSVCFLVYFTISSIALLTMTGDLIFIMIVSGLLHDILTRIYGPIFFCLLAPGQQNFFFVVCHLGFTWIQYYPLLLQLLNFSLLTESQLPSSFTLLIITLLLVNEFFCKVLAFMLHCFNHHYFTSIHSSSFFF